jgi:hypothetical protein
MGSMIAYNILLRKPDGKRPLGRPWHSHEDNIKMVVTEIWCESVHWIQKPQTRDLWQVVMTMAIMKFWVA